MTRVRLLPLLLAAACSHSESFGPQADRPEEPFSIEEPVRLTYASGLNTRPAFSEDERRIVYAFPRGDDGPDDHDHDTCLGVLPTSGGPRVAEYCVEERDHRSFRDGVEHGALSADGRLAFVRASGLAGSFTVARAGLYVAPADSVRGAREVLELKRIPPGGSTSWDYLLNPTWVGPGELVALATRTELRGPNVGKDTLHFGIDVVRIRVDDQPVTWTSIAPGMGAGEMTLDRSTGMLYLLGHRYFDAVGLAVIADTVWRVPLSGGTPEPVFGLPNATSSPGERIFAITAGGNRLLGTRGRLIGGAPGFDVVELTVDAPPQQLPLTLPGNPGRLALSSDGALLIAEVFSPDGIRLYRTELP